MSISNLFNQYETIRADSAFYEEVETRVVTFRVPSVDFAFLNALADHYLTPRAHIVRDVLEESMREFFDMMPPDQRMTIAQRAHDLFLQDMKKSCPGWQFHGVSKWLGLAKAMEKDQERIPEVQEMPL